MSDVSWTWVWLGLLVVAPLLYLVFWALFIQAAHIVRRERKSTPFYTAAFFGLLFAACIGGTVLVMAVTGNPLFWWKIIGRGITFIKERVS